MLTRRESVSLDRWITQSPPEDEEMYCSLCGLPSDSCEEEEEHEGHWETLREHAREVAEETMKMQWEEEHE